MSLQPPPSISADKRASRVSFLDNLPSLPRFTSRIDLQARRRSSAVYEWTSNAVEKVYINHVYAVSLYLLAATVVAVLMMTFPLSHVMPHLRGHMTIKIASRAALVLSFVTLLSLRSYFSYSIDLLALGAVVLVTSFEVSDLIGSSQGLDSMVFSVFLSVLLVVGANFIAIAAKPNVLVLASVLLVNLLLVTNFNFIAAILERRPSVVVDLIIYSSSVSFAALAIIGFAMVVSDGNDCPFQVSDKISSGTILYLLVIYLFANFLLVIDTIRAVA